MEECCLLDRPQCLGGIFFIVRVARCWNRLPRGVVGIPFREVSKARLDWALNNLVKQEMSLAMAGGLELDGFFQLKPLSDSVTWLLKAPQLSMYRSLTRTLISTS